MSFQNLKSHQSRLRSLDDPAIVAEMETSRPHGENPLDILIRLESKYGTVTDEDLELVLFDNPLR